MTCRVRLSLGSFGRASLLPDAIEVEAWPAGEAKVASDPAIIGEATAAAIRQSTRRYNQFGQLVFLAVVNSR